MLETSARLLRLLSLFQGRKYWSGHDLSARLEVTSRTLRRDVDKLRTGISHPFDLRRGGRISVGRRFHHASIAAR
jgi:predicted DNA-binding transcriptional regulator YafY